MLEEAFATINTSYESQEYALKILPLLLISLLFVPPLYADQALVLTEIEQIQEKVWYLQRDVAAQKAGLDKHQKELASFVKASEKLQLGVKEQLAVNSQLVSNQQNRLQEMEVSLQQLNEAVNALVSEFNQQKTAQLQQAEKSGSQEGLLQALREDVAANRKEAEQALAETSKQVAETRAQLQALQTDKSQSFDQLALYLGGAALALAVLLTVGFAFLNSKSNRRFRERENLPKHEL